MTIYKDGDYMGGIMNNNSKRCIFIGKTVMNYLLPQKRNNAVYTYL